MKINILDLIDFDKIDILLEGFNKSTGFVTAILDLEGKVLSKSGWRQMCTHFHRVNPETSKKCTISDTILAGKLAAGEKYHFYKCLNGLVDVAVPIVINGEHIANLFSGQFFFEEPDRKFFKNQAEKYGFDEEEYLKALEIVPVVSEEKVKTAMDFLLNMTQMISEMTFQKLEQTVLNEDLQNSKEYNRSLFAESPIGLLLTAINGKLIDANPAFCKIIGRTLEETLNLTYWDITPEKYSLQEAEQLKSLETKGNYGPYEKEYIHKDGYLVSVRLQGNIMERKGQKYIWSSVEDITERKKGEIRLRDEKEQKRIILELVGDPIFLKDNDHRIIFANQAFFDLFGLNEKSVIGKTLAENVPENERKHFLEIDRNVLDTGIPDYREEELIVGKQTNTIITRKTRFIDESGNRFLVGSIHNITERKMAEDRLKKSEHNLSEAERIGNTGSWEYDVASDTASWSENMFHIFDVDQEMPTELVFKHFVDNLVHPDDRQNVLFVFQDALSGKRPYNLEYRTIKSDGSLRIIHAIAETIRDENGNAIRMLGKVEDITERKKAEEEILKLNRTYSVISQINQMIVRAHNNDILFNEVCRIAVDFGKFQMAWIGLVNEENTFVNPIASAGTEDGYLSKIKKIPVNDIPEGRGPTGTAIREGKTVVCDDITNDPRMAPWNADALKLGYRSSISLPIKSFGKVIGSFNIYSLVPHFFDKKEIYLLEEVTNDISFAIQAIETEKQRVQAEENLHKTNQLIKNIIDYNPSLIYLFDTDGKFMLGNKNFENFLGFPESELLGKPREKFLPIEISNQHRSNDFKVINSKQPITLEEENLEADGKHFYLTVKFPLIDSDGNVYAVGGVSTDITYRKLAEVELKKSEERFRTLFEHAPDGFFVADTNGYYVDVNTSGAQMLGYKRDEIIGLHLFDIVQPQVTSLVDKDYKEVKAGKQYHSEWEFKRKDGSILQGDLIDATLPDGNVLGIVRDITERKKAEEALREREEKFKSIFETANAGKSITLPTGEMDANEAFCKMLGYTREELKYKRWQEITPEEEIPTIEKILEPLLKGEKDSVRFEKRYICKNETLIWADISIAIRCDENGKPLYLITTIIDITERKLAERALHESNERLKLIFENTPIAIWDWDLKSDRWFATPKYYTMLGYEPEDGYPDRTVWLKRIHPDDRESVAKKITNIMNRSKKDYSYDARMLHADGTYRWQIVIGHVIEYDENQNAQRMIGIRIDINERKKAEEEISKLNRELEQRVKERTEELEAANKDLEEINDLFIGRESRIIELKEELEKLKSKSHLG